jgi:acetyl esterase/lipase
MRQRIAYGDHPSQFGELWLPDGAAGPVPVVVLVHGGFWRERYGCDEMHALAADAAGRGWAAWNLEYRRVGGDGGWPQTRMDVEAGVAHLAELARDHPLDTARVAAVGHSAGGHLALLCGGACTAVVAQAAVSDPLDAYVRGLSGSAVADFLGGPPDLLGDVYRDASPLINVPLGVAQLLVHGDADEDVPVEQSRIYVAAARDARDDVEYVELPGVGHMEHTDPESSAWQAAVEYLARLFTPLRPSRG